MPQSLAQRAPTPGIARSPKGAPSSQPAAVGPGGVGRRRHFERGCRWLRFVEQEDGEAPDHHSIDRCSLLPDSVLAAAGVEHRGMGAQRKRGTYWSSQIFPFQDYGVEQYVSIKYYNKGLGDL
jgi:hypothetical protein